MSKQKFICETCGKEYTSYKHNSKFCCKDCQIKSRRKYNFNCSYCGKEFQVSPSKAKTINEGLQKRIFCSRDCANLGQNTSVVKKCEWCKKDFLISKSLSETQKYCSKSCSYEASRKCKIIKCKECGKKFLQKHADQIYCGVDCRNASYTKREKVKCENCGKLFDIKKYRVNSSKRHYCSFECKKSDMFWSDNEKESLINAYGIVDKSTLIEMYSGRWGYDAIRRKAQNLNITNDRTWTDEEIRIIKDVYPTLPFNQVMNELPGRSRSSIMGKARVLNLKSKFYLDSIYSDEEENFLKENYIRMTNSELATALGRTERAVYQHMYYMGLHRPVDPTKYKNLKQYARIKLIPWKNKVMRENDFTCQITGQRGDVVIHHIRGFNLLFNEAIAITEIPNSDDMSTYTQEDLDDFINVILYLQEYYGAYICISNKLHIAFHKQFGYGNNTEEQWNEFIS